MAVFLNDNSSLQGGQGGAWVDPPKTSVSNPSIQPVNDAHAAGAAQDSQVYKQQQAEQQQAAAEEARRQMVQQRIANQPYYQGVALGIVRALTGNKERYEAASQAYANETDDAKRQQYQSIMTDAEKAAGLAREEAARRGLDISAYGSDVTAADARAALANQGYRAYDAAMEYPMTSEEYFSQKFEELRDNGWGRRSAANEARRMAAEYRRERVKQLRNTLYDWGIDKERNALNQLGASITSQLAEEAPIEASGYTNLFANPKSEYEYQNDIAKIALNQDNRLAQIAATGQMNNWLAENQWQRGEKTADNNVIRDIETHRGKAVIDLEKSQAAFRQRMGNIQALANAGFISNEQMQSIIGSLAGGGKGGNGSGSGSQKGTLNKFDKNRFDALVSLKEGLEGKAAAVGGIENLDSSDREMYSRIESEIQIMSGIDDKTPAVTKAQTLEQALDAMRNIVAANRIAPENSQKTDAEIIQYMKDNVRPGWVRPLAERLGIDTSGLE